MKPLVVLAAASMVANVAMGIWLVNRRDSGRTLAPPVSLARPQTVPTDRYAAPSIDSRKTSPNAGNLAARDSSWAKSLASDLPGLIARLRENGFPPAVIRAIVMAQLREKFADRYRALAATLAAAPYWRNNEGLSDPTIDRAQRSLDREVAELATRLLGPAENEMSEAMRVANQRLYGDLSVEKVNEMIRIKADYADLTYQARTEARGLALPEDAAKLALISQELHADIARLLTPAEQTAYDLRDSATSDRLRRQLATLNSTEEEFRALWNLQRPLDLQYGSNLTYLTPEQRRLRAEAESALEPQFAAILGPARYAEFQKSRRVVSGPR